MEENQVVPTGNSPEPVEPILSTEPHSSLESENLAPGPEGLATEPENTSPEPVSPDPAPTFETNNLPEPAPKKKKTGLLLLIILLVLLVVGAIVAILLLTKSPEQDIKTASSKFFDTLTAITTAETTNVKNKNLKIDGDVEINVPSQYSQSTNYNLGMIFEANDHSDARMVLNMDGNVGIPITFSLEGRKITNGSNYLKTNGIVDLISNYITSNMFGYSSKNDQAQRFLDAISELDDSWLEINTEELQDYIKDLTEEMEKTGNISSYLIASSQDSLCLSSNIDYNKIASSFDSKDMEKLLSFELYKDNDGKVDRGTPYLVKVDATSLVDLYQKYYEAIKQSILSAVKVCGLEDNEAYKEENIKTPEIKASDIEKWLDEILPDIYVVIDNSEIIRVFSSFNQSGIDFNINLDISYPESIEIETPENAKSIIEIIEALRSIFETSKEQEKGSLLGTWTYQENPEYKYMFNEDGTCSYMTTMICTYRDNGGSVEILYEGDTDSSTYKYRVEGNTLYIEDSFGNEIEYVKENSLECPDDFYYYEEARTCIPKE